MKITATGKGLKIAIMCDNSERHNWMSIACWYSCLKNLPDAEVIVVTESHVPEKDMFRWSYKFKVPLLRHDQKVSNDFLRLPPFTMAVREYDENAVGPVCCKTDEDATFVTYKNGCGKFKLLEWIDRRGAPFRYTPKFYTSDITVNESKVLKLWERISPIYSMT